MKKYCVIFLLLPGLLSCQKKMTKKSESTDKTTNAIKNIIVDPSIDITATGASYNIDSTSIKGDVLSVFVNYSGGCNEHTFDLYSNGNYAKSLPVQMMLCLKHTNNDDNCRMLIMKELQFNIAAIKKSNYETIVLKIGSYSINYNSK